MPGSAARRFPSPSRPANRRRRLVAAAVTAALTVVLATAGAALGQQVTRGSDLQRAPMAAPPGDGSDCLAQPAPATDSNPYVFAPNFAGATSCSWLQTGVSGATFNTDPRSGYVGRSGVVTQVQVRVGPNPAPLRFFVARQLTPASQLGNPAGNPECCFFVSDRGPFQPAPNAVSTFTVNLPVETSRAPGVITNDLIGFSAAAGAGSIPIARVPGQDRNFTLGQPGTLNATGFWPALGTEPNDTGGGRPGWGYGGIEVLLRYTVAPAAGAPIVPGAPIRLGPTDVVRIGGNVLRPIGPALDVVIACLQANCNGALRLLTRSPVRAAAKGKGKRKVRALGTKRFALKRGRGRKVRVKLNKLGRKLSKRGRTKVTVVVDLGPIGKTRRNTTLARAVRR